MNLVEKLAALSRVHPAVRTGLLPLIWARRGVRRILNRRRDLALDRLAALLADDVVLSVDSFGGRFAMSASSSLFRQLVIHGEYESTITRTYLERIDRTRDALDIGANVGLHTVLLARTLTDGRVLAIEPTANALRHLRRNLEMNGVQGKVAVFEGVASNLPGTAELKTIPGREEYSSMGALDHPTISGVPYEKVMVKASTVDQLVAQHGLAPGFVKLDVEGCEHLVVEGARHTLRNYRPLVIFELSDFLLRRNGSSALAVVSEFKRLDYEVVDLLHPNVTPGARDFCDVVCVPR